jgi:uncharacterized membrane protein YhaH (DUF805 family)
MPISQLLFSFRGRINRAKFWLITILSAVVSIAVGLIAFVSAYSQAENFTILFFVLFFILFVPMIWIGLAVAGKRLHDRDKSAWWLLLFYVAPGILQGIGDQFNDVLAYVFYLPGFAIWIWALVELGFLRGTVGPNQYGPDPLQRASEAGPLPA